jgi:structural maintenance of chromosome 3 (chondroitin sulfate proteoglycan 6)
MEREKKLSILYQKQGRATQFSSKAARDKWLQKEIDDLERVLSSNTTQARIHLMAQVILNYTIFP